MHIVLIFYAFLFAMLLVLIEVHHSATLSDNSGHEISRPTYEFTATDSLMIEEVKCKTEVYNGPGDLMEPPNSTPGLAQPLPADAIFNSAQLKTETHEKKAGIQQGSVFTSRDVVKGVNRKID